MIKLIIKAHVLSMCLLLTLPIHAKLLKHEVFQISKKEFSFKHVCKTMLKKEYPLIQVHSTSKLDCMSQLVDAGKFCDKELADDPYLVRGFVDRKDKKVKCQSGRRVIVKYDCTKGPGQYCDDSSIGCYYIKEKLARRLKVSHHSLTGNGRGKKELNCYFSLNNYEDLK
jgi:hypothetical protein